ncbi:actinodin2 [Neoarius graeffei]|uniref:actinodin2 n=1 Tax=Neoarius graeffei TaxID=443677 RepID=UPI00298D4EB3|nr:actinodin2 [Neoarius graeffei]
MDAVTAIIFAFDANVMNHLMNNIFVGSVAELAEEKPASSLALKKLTRNKRNAVAHYQRLPESWYKYYVDTHNQEGIESLDQLYLIYLQNKRQAEGDNSYKHYLARLSEVYKTCAKSDDPDCIPEYTSKSPSPILLPMRIKSPSGYHYYAPALESFLSNEQRAELLRICSPSDVECLQYHLRAAYGYRPALTPVPSYAYLGCDPYKDPHCTPTMIAQTPSGLYHVYPHCNPTVDPLCVSNIAPAAQSAVDAPKEQYCNPLFEKGCNPLTANRLVTRKTPVLQYATPKCHPYDPNCSKFSPPASVEAVKNTQDGIIFPHPDCDPEIDYNCRLRRAEQQTKANKKTAEEPKDELESGDTRKTKAAPQYQFPRFEDFLRGYLGHYKK